LYNRKKWTGWELNPRPQHLSHIAFLGLVFIHTTYLLQLVMCRENFLFKPALSIFEEYVSI
jgi:hypothetical protein